MDNNYTRVINVEEFQQKILDYISSDELDKTISNTVFVGKPECKRAVAHGMALASMLTSTCETMYVKDREDKEEQMEENKKINTVAVGWI